MLQIFYTNIQNLLVHYNKLINFPLMQSLPLDSQKKILAYLKQSDQIRSFISEVFKFKLLPEILNIPSTNFRIQIDEYGKPYLPDKMDIDFNISHSGDYVFIVISSIGSVGIDIEKIDVDIKYHELKKLVFSDTEMALINNPIAFINLWVKKEAFIKAMGCGFLNDTYQTTKLTHNANQVYSYNNHKYIFQRLTIDDQYKAYVCIQSGLDNNSVTEQIKIQYYTIAI